MRFLILYKQEVASTYDNETSYSKIDSYIEIENESALKAWLEKNNKCSDYSKIKDFKIVECFPVEYSVSYNINLKRV